MFAHADVEVLDQADALDGRLEHALVVVEHDMDFVRRLDCRVTVLHEGAVLAEGTLDFVSSNQDVIEVYLGR